MTRKLTWMRQVRPGPVARYVTNDKPVVVPDTWERHTGPALYDDGGPFVVVDTVAGLQYAVIDIRDMTALRTFPVSLKEACDFAYDANRAEERLS